MPYLEWDAANISPEVRRSQASPLSYQARSPTASLWRPTLLPRPLPFGLGSEYMVAGQVGSWIRDRHTSLYCKCVTKYSAHLSSFHCLLTGVHLVAGIVLLHLRDVELCLDNVDQGYGGSKLYLIWDIGFISILSTVIFFHNGWWQRMALMKLQFSPSSPASSSWWHPWLIL